MPDYTFKCPICSVSIDVKQSMNASAPICERCKDVSSGIHTPIMERVWKMNSEPQFKGGGWAKDNYSKPPKPS